MNRISLKPKIILLHLIFAIFLTQNTFAQKDYQALDIKMSKDKNLQEIKVLQDVANKRVETKFYGDDLKLLQNIDKDCFKNRIDCIKCLKNLGFKKADEYVKLSFDITDRMAIFKKENPEFYQLDKNLQFKLLKKYLIM